jgi:thiol-disulfide isomerase/thioredoxin
VYAARVSAVMTVALLVGSGCSSTPRTVRAASLRPSKERKKAPDFALKDANGQTVHLSDYRGKVVLLDLWATWCGPCKVEIPWFQEFERQYKDKGFAVIGVAMDDEGWEVVKPFAQERGINYRLVLGNDAIADLYKIEAWPTTLLIDREGNVASIHVGLTGKTIFEDGIQELLSTPGNPSAPALFVRAK